MVALAAPAPVAPLGYAEGEIIHHDLILAEVTCPLCGAPTEIDHDFYDEYGDSYYIDLECAEGHRWRFDPYNKGENLFRCREDPTTWED